MTFAIIMLCVAGLLILPRLYLSMAKKHWSETTGIITKAKPGFARGFDIGKTKAVRTYEISYEFTVGNRAYAGTETVQIDQPYHEVDDAIAEFKEFFKDGDTITVYYAPASPGFNSLKRTIELGKPVFAIGFLMLMIAGFYLFIIVTADSMDQQQQRAKQRYRQNPPPAETAPANPH